MKISGPYRIVGYIPSAVLIAFLLTGALEAAETQELFNADMEAPDVASYSVGTLPAGWIKATGGSGSGRVGLTDEASGDFTSPDPASNHQAIAFRYTNSGMTTDDGEIGEFALGTVYTITFDTTADFGRSGNTDTVYNVYFMVFSNGVTRTDCRSTPAGAKLLASRGGNAPTDGSFANISFTYTPHLTNDVGWVGEDVTVRLRGQTSAACIDNVTVSWIPPPQAGTIFIFH